MLAAEGVGRDQGFALSDSAGPAGQVVGGDVHVEPGCVGAKAACREVVEPDTVFEVADRVLDDGVAAVVGFELDGVAVAVGDERVVAVVDEQGELAAGGTACCCTTLTLRSGLSCQTRICLTQD